MRVGLVAGCASAASGAARRPPVREPMKTRRVIIRGYLLGNVNRKVEPLPTSLSTQIRPRASRRTSWSA
jgi:hypothetical protein